MNKAFFKSGKFWFSILTLISGFFPKVQEIIASDPEVVTNVVGGLGAIASMIKKKEVKLEIKKEF